MPDFDVISTLPHGPGRIYKEDSRDRRYPLRALALAAEKSLATVRAEAGARGVQLPEIKYWHSHSFFADQGQTGMCVGYAGLNWVHDGPVTHKALRVPFIDPVEAYQGSRLADGFAVDPTLQEGSTTRGICEFLRHLGVIKSYHWASFDDPVAALDEVVFALRGLGPVFFGTDWTEGMFTQDRDRLIRPTGRVVGGHEVVLNGVNMKRRVVRYECAWDAEKPYFGFIRFEDLVLLFRGIDYPADAAFALENQAWRP